MHTLHSESLTCLLLAQSFLTLCLSCIEHNALIRRCGSLSSVPAPSSAVCSPPQVILLQETAAGDCAGGARSSLSTDLPLQALSAILRWRSSCRGQQPVTFTAHARQGAASPASMPLQALSAVLCNGTSWQKAAGLWDDNPDLPESSAAGWKHSQPCMPS